MKYITLGNGIKMPMAGIGVFMMSPAEAEASVESALRSGVRLIDTANGYMNESGTGRGIKKSGGKESALRAFKGRQKRDAGLRRRLRQAKRRLR